MRFRPSHFLPLLALVAVGCGRDSDADRNAPTTLTSATVVSSASSWNGTYEFSETGQTDYVVFVAGDAASPHVTVTSTGVRKMKLAGRGVPRGDALAVIFEAAPVAHEAPNLAKGDEVFTLTRSGDAVSLVFSKLPPTGSQKSLLRSPPRAARH